MPENDHPSQNLPPSGSFREGVFVSNVRYGLMCPNKGFKVQKTI